MGPPRAHSPRARSAGASNPAGDKPGSHELGQKVSVLFRLADDAAHPFNEVVGLLQSVDDSDPENPRYSVIRRNGEAVEFDSSQIVSWKVVPT